MGGEGGRGNWRGNQRGGFDGGRGWLPRGRGWNEGRGGGRGDFGGGRDGGGFMHQEQGPPGGPPQQQFYGQQPSYGEQQFQAPGQFQFQNPPPQYGAPDTQWGGNQQYSGFGQQYNGHGGGAGDQMWFDQRVPGQGQNNRFGNSGGSAASGEKRMATSTDSTGSAPPQRDSAVAKGVVDKPQGSGSAGGGEGQKAGCFRCTQPGHVVKDCKTVLFCIHCGRKEAHLSERCGMLNKPPAVMKLVGCANDGLQMLLAQTGRKPENDKMSQAIGLVQVIEGEATVDSLTAAFAIQFPWGNPWKFKDYGDSSFLVKFPGFHRLKEMCEYPMFGLRGSRAVVRVSKWELASVAKFKLYSVWVRISGVPPTLLHRDGFAEMGSMIGSVQDVDMEGYRKDEVIRVKVGVTDPAAIPAVAPFTEDPFVYHIFFEVEDVVEEGGKLVDGILVGSEGASAQKGRSYGKGNRNPKRSKNSGAPAQGQQGQQQSVHAAEGSKSHDVEDENVNMVLSSQPEIDRQAEEDLRQIMLEKKRALEQKKTSGVEGINHQFANDAKMIDRVECSDTESEHSASQELPDDIEKYAREELGLNTQDMVEINREVEQGCDIGNTQLDSMGVGEGIANNDQMLQANRVVAGGNIKNFCKERDNAIDENRRRTPRVVSDQHIMEKAMDRAKVKNLEVPIENRTSKNLSQRSKASGPGGQ